MKMRAFKKVNATSALLPVYIPSLIGFLIVTFYETDTTLLHAVCYRK